MGDGRTCSIAAPFRDRIYVVTGNGVVLDYDQKTQRQFTYTPSPEAPSLVCFDKNTGAVIWIDRSPGTNMIAGQWGSPLVAEIHGRGQVITPQGDGWVRSFDAETGALIWSFDINIPPQSDRRERNHFLNTPVLYQNRVYIGGTVEMEQGEGPGRLWCLDPTKQGNISLELPEGLGRTKPNPNSGVVWHFDSIGRTRPNVAIQDDLLVAAGFDGIVHFLDAVTGREFWNHDTKAHLFGSPLIVAGKVYVGDEDGIVYVLGFGRERRVLSRINMGNYVYASPIFANGTLYLATPDALYAITNDAELTATSWPQWRGPDRRNASKETGLLQQWPTNGPPLRWITTGLGEGITAVAVSGDRAYTLGIRDEEEFLFCLEAKSGAGLWESPLGSPSNRKVLRMDPLMRWLSPRVPTVDGDRVYTMTASGVLSCLQTHDGKLLWQKSYPDDFLSPPRNWGFCDYPLVDGENLICAPAGPGAAIVALNKRTGEIVWKSSVPGASGAGYAAVVVSEATGIRQYVALLANGLVGIAADDGRLLWRHPRPPLRIASSYTPIVQGDWVCSPNGYGGGLTLLGLTLDKSGITPVEQYHQDFKFNSFQDATTLVGDHLYAIERAGKEVCIEVQTGQRLWTADGPDQTRRAALTYADGRLYVRRSDASMSLVEASPGGYVRRGSFQIPDPEEAAGVTFPVVADGHLYLRDNRRLLCYDVRAGALRELTAAIRTNTIVPGNTAVSSFVASPSSTRTGLERAPDAIYVSTPDDVVAKMLELVDLNSQSLLYDLGSGDGRIVIAAAQKYGCRAIGVEIDPRLVAQSREAVRNLGLTNLIRIEQNRGQAIDWFIYFSKSGRRYERSKPCRGKCESIFPVPSTL